jgi:hypothetical protein
MTMCASSGTCLPTLSAEASPAKTLAMPAEAPELKGSAADSGLNLLGSLASFDPAGPSWRTSQHSLDGGLTAFSETWPRSGMTRSGIAYQLQPLAPLTGGIESGSWPTPDASVAQDGEKPETWLARRERVKAKAINGNGMGMPLTIAVQLWPTPTSRDWKDGSAKACANVPANGLLGRVVHQYPTPHANCHTGPGEKGQGGPNLQTVVGGSLNPTWVEWLMGFPLEWTVCELSATRSSRRSRKSSGERS